MARRRKRRSPLIPLITAAAVFILFLFFFRWSNHSLQVEHFSCSLPQLPQNFHELTVVHLTDLHGAEFGENNDALFRAVSDAHPDLVVITGDLLEKTTDEQLPELVKTAGIFSRVLPEHKMR